MRSIGTTAAMTAMLIAVCFVFSAAAQQGKTYTHSDGGIEFTAPDKWEAETEGDMLTLSSPDGAIGVFFLVVDAKDLEVAVDALTSELDKIITDAKLTSEGSETMINGLNAFYADGSGKLDGVPIEFGVMLVAGKKPVMILAVGESTSLKQHEADVTALMKSIKPVK